MLNYEILGPTSSGKFLVAYNTPGCDLPTVMCVCTTLAQAAQETNRLNGAYQDQGDGATAEQ